MCEQCSAEVSTYLSPIPGWWLVRATKDGTFMKADQWGLLRAADPDFVWNVTPWPEPMEGSNEELENQWSKDWGQFNECLNSRVGIGWQLINGCIELGFDPEDSFLAPWLFDHLGKWIQTKKSFSFHASNNAVVADLENFGYVEPQKITRVVGQIYEVVCPHEMFTECAVAYKENGSESVPTEDLIYGSKVLLVKSNEDYPKVLLNKNLYEVHRLFLSKEPVSGKE